MIRKIGVPFYIELNSHQKYFGATGFKTKVVNLSDGTMTELSNDAEEIVDTIDSPATATVAEAAAAGVKQVKVDTNSTLEDGMVVKDQNNNMYYIESINGDIVKFKFPLKQGIAYGDTLTQVGNTGVYKIEVTINKVGNYGVYISNPSIDLRTKGLQFDLKDVLIEDVYAQVEDKYNQLASQLNDIQTSISAGQEQDFEVYSS